MNAIKKPRGMKGRNKRPVPRETSVLAFDDPDKELYLEVDDIYRASYRYKESIDGIKNPSKTDLYYDIIKLGIAALRERLAMK